MQPSMQLSHRMEQKIIMTRQMIQSIEMLQLPLMDLQQSITAELEANPWLEPTEMGVESQTEQAEEREEGEGVDGEDGEVGLPPESDSALDTYADDERFAQPEAAEAEAPAPPDGDDPRLARMEALLEEWNDPRTRSDSGFSHRAGEDDAKLEAMRNTAAPNTSLEEHLLEQLHFSKEDENMKELAEVIIGSLDEHGMLKVAPMDLFYRSEGGVRVAALDREVSQDEADLALMLVQSFDPAGVGARSLQECLLLQLRRLPGDTSFEEQLITKHLDDISHNRLPKIAKDLGVSVEKVKEGVDHISHLNPNPGRSFGGTRPQYVVPDVAVEEIEGKYVININEHYLPSLRISAEQLELLRSEPKDSQTREYLMNKVGSAVWLMESVIQRRNTLYRITEQIVDIQKAFLEHGPSHLKPLMMQEVAERIGMHVSTVSRALAGKYIQTPQGLFAMKYFFTGGFSTGDGESESNRAIMLKIKDMCDKEDKAEPLSDQEIVKRLESEGIEIARRTVAKYREKLSIPSSRQRKTY
ncbi:MAG: RNA polymerase factor sigma-54 [Planctomycetes bacterium]|nr:RNA polymerase factor sigma-54 [Planctomycetota bacterium]